MHTFHDLDTQTGRDRPQHKCGQARPVTFTSGIFLGPTEKVALFLLRLQNEQEDEVSLKLLAGT
jgi:hypothetical protein